MKKEVIAYLHTHWDREWYREFETFRIRLLRVFDIVLDLLETNKIPCFYFDGQVSALEDYLQIRPEKELLIRNLICDKKLFIGPFYCLVDEFLTSKDIFRKNLEYGLNVAKAFGCNDFIAYFADTFGHSKNMMPILKDFGIDKAVVWRGCPKALQSEFIFNGINTVNLLRGYFMDIFSAPISIEKKAEFLKINLDKIAQKSSNTLLLPIGADHLGVQEDILAQIEQVNKLLKDYQIKLGSIFDYFNKVKFEKVYNEELLDNSQTFILQGSHSSRMDLKQYNVECTHKLVLADKAQKYFNLNYDNLIEYAYKLILHNQAHDAICGCSLDDVHFENELKYKKVLQIANTILDEVRLKMGENKLINLSDKPYTGCIEFESIKKHADLKLISKRKGFENEILSDIYKIPITEDYKYIYKYQTFVKNVKPYEVIDLQPFEIPKTKIKIEVKDTLYINGLPFDIVDYKDFGDSYNFGPIKNDKGEVAKLVDYNILENNDISVKYKLKNEVLNLTIIPEDTLVRFKLKWKNKRKNHLLQARFKLENNIEKTYSEDMNELIERNIDYNYDIRKNLPKTRGIEAKTSTYPMQRFVFANGLGVFTKGLTEYEVVKNNLSITLIRATGVISNPKNSSRSTPAGPPLETPNLQMLKDCYAEFAVCFGEKDVYKNIDRFLPNVIS